MRFTGLVLSQSFSAAVCVVDQIPYPTSGNRSLFIWQPAPAKYMFSMRPTGTAADSYLKSITSTVLCFFIARSLSLLECIMCLFIFAWIYLFINIHYECHICDSFEKKKKKREIYCFFILSQLGFIASHCCCYHNTFIEMYLASLLFASYYRTTTSKHCGSLVGNGTP